MDMIVTRLEQPMSFRLTDLFGRSMGQVVAGPFGGFAIRPVGGAIEIMAGMKLEPHNSLDVALSEIETHTRGICRRAHGEDVAWSQPRTEP